jgi:hypothetical protein
LITETKSLSSHPSRLIDIDDSDSSNGRDKNRRKRSSTQKGMKQIQDQEDNTDSQKVQDFASVKQASPVLDTNRFTNPAEQLQDVDDHGFEGIKWEDPEPLIEEEDWDVGVLAIDTGLEKRMRELKLENMHHQEIDEEVSRQSSPRKSRNDKDQKTNKFLKSSKSKKYLALSSSSSSQCSLLKSKQKSKLIGNVKSKKLNTTKQKVETPLSEVELPKESKVKKKNKFGPPPSPSTSTSSSSSTSSSPKPKKSKSRLKQRTVSSSQTSNQVGDEFDLPTMPDYASMTLEQVVDKLKSFGYKTSKNLKSQIKFLEELWVKVKEQRRDDREKEMKEREGVEVVRENGESDETEVEGINVRIKKGKMRQVSDSSEGSIEKVVQSVSKKKKSKKVVDEDEGSVEKKLQRALMMDKNLYLKILRYEVSS